MATLSAVVNLGARNPLTVDCSSRIADEWGTMGFSLIPTPCCPYVLPTSMTDKSNINNKTMPEGAKPALFPLCHLPAPPLPEDEFRVVFILYLLNPILYVFPNMLFFICIHSSNSVCDLLSLL